MTEADIADITTETAFTLPWEHAWRVGIAPQADTDGLLSLLTALSADDPRLVQGACTVPPPLRAYHDWPVEAADAVVWLEWRGAENPDCDSVGDCERAFARLMSVADDLLGVPAGAREFLGWFDDTPRAEMRSTLSAMIRSELWRRAAAERKENSR